MPFQKSNPSLYGWSEGGTHFVSHSKNDVKQLICVKLALAVLPGPAGPEGICWVNAGGACRWPESWGVFCTPKLYSFHHGKNMQSRNFLITWQLLLPLSLLHSESFLWTVSNRGCWPCTHEQPRGSWDGTMNGWPHSTWIMHCLLIARSVCFLIPTRQHPQALFGLSRDTGG